MKKEALEMQNYLEITCQNSPEEIIERINTIGVYMARSVEMLANAKRLLKKKRSEEIAGTILEIAKQNFLSAKAQNVLIDSIAADEWHLVDWLDRINRTCVHQINALRSLLSYEKSLIGINY